MSALLAAKYVKADPIVAVDINEDKLKKAKALGATHVVNARLHDPVSALVEITAGKGVDYIFESAGSKEAMEKAFCSLKAPGMCVLAGNLPQGQKIEINPFDLILGKKIVGTWGGKSDIDRDVREYVDLFLKGEIDLKSLITHEVAIDEINSLMGELENGSVGRGLIEIR